MIKNKIELPISNYYGQPYVYYNSKDKKYYLVLDDYDTEDKTEISKQFYNSCKKEFCTGIK